MYDGTITRLSYSAFRRWRKGDGNLRKHEAEMVFLYKYLLQILKILQREFRVLLV